MFDYIDDISLSSYLISHPLILMDEKNIKLKKLEIDEITIPKKIFRMKLSFAKKYISAMRFKNNRIFDIKELYSLFKKYDNYYTNAIRFKNIFDKHYNEDLSKAVDEFALYLIEKQDDDYGIVFNSLYLIVGNNVEKEVKVIDDIVKLYNSITSGQRYTSGDIYDIFFDDVLNYLSFVLGNDKKEEYEEIKKFFCEYYPEITL